MRAPSWLSVSFLSVVLGFDVAAQTYSVRNDGSGDFDDLQTALDSVPDGSTLLVSPNEDDYGFDYGWGGIVIQQSVTLVGVDSANGMASIGGGGATFGGGPLQTVLFIDAADDSTIVVANLYIWLYGDFGPSYGIEVERAGTLIIDRSIVTGTGYPAELPMPFFQDPSDGVFVPGSVGLIALSESELVGGDGNAVSNVGDDGSDCHGDGTVLGCPGGNALRAPGAGSIVVSGSTLLGGAGGTACWGDGWAGDGCGDTAPIQLRGGDGGNGISGDAFISGSSLTPGSAGSYVFRDTDWGNGEDGDDGVDVSGVATPLPDLLAVTGTPARGASITLTANGLDPSGVALLFTALSLNPGVHIKRGEWFLGVPFFLIGAIPTSPAGGFSLGGNLPGDPAFSGIAVVLQVADANHLSEPELFVIREN